MGACFSTRLVVRGITGDEFPNRSEKADDSCCGLDPVGGLTSPPRWWVSVVWRSSVEDSSLSRPPLLATSAADCNGRPQEKTSSPTRTLWGRRMRHECYGCCRQTGIGSEFYCRELVAGRAVIVLTILEFAEVSPTFLVALASIVFGVALLLYGAAALSQLNAALVDIRPPTTDTTGLQTMAGLAAIVLGILALSGFAPTKLVLIALLQLGCFSSLTRASSQELSRARSDWRRTHKDRWGDDPAWSRGRRCRPNLLLTLARQQLEASLLKPEARFPIPRGGSLGP